MSHKTEAAMLEAVDELTDFFDAESVSMRPRLLARLLQKLALECAAHELDKRAVSKRSLKFLSPIMRELTPEEKESGKIGFNAPCVCGSGRKFKRCCYGKHPAERQRAAEPQDVGQEETK